MRRDWPLLTDAPIVYRCLGMTATEHVNRIRYPSPNVVGLSARKAAR